MYFFPTTLTPFKPFGAAASVVDASCWIGVRVSLSMVVVLAMAVEVASTPIDSGGDEVASDVVADVVVGTVAATVSGASLTAGNVEVEESSIGTVDVEASRTGDVVASDAETGEEVAST